jgi:hypothetical protein
MQVPVQPLSEEEEARLRELLAQTGSVSLPYARGVFSALACEPTQADPSDWLGWVLSGEVPDKQTLTRTFAFLMRDFYAIRECLVLGQPYAPHPEEKHALVQFCKGFVRVTQASKVWQEDTDALGLILPLAVVAGYLKLDSLRKVQPNLKLQESDWETRQRQELADQVSKVYTHFEAHRTTLAAIATVAKVGRNEACPCGSGKKFKKCCGVGG